MFDGFEVTTGYFQGHQDQFDQRLRNKMLPTANKSTNKSFKS